MKARQFITCTMVVVYLTAMAGFAFNIHFCGGKLDNVSLFNAEAGCAMCAKMAGSEKEDGCCKDTHVEVKVKDGHQQVAKTMLSKAAEFVLFYTPDFQDVLGIEVLSQQKFAFNKAPPDGKHPSKNILYCTFRI